ncbi:glycoside hydrolase family 3 protein [Saccharata proteae CBS 121410]|uniref:beta-glucosidase n=1 Tax=Saccharata proteae CBS 121410 TaxID=1314787 RepID=A0A9P4HR29_9PEZI|nr:glycoside hydrolase family 3 protein [Saccharata proteae CBS 121410]
MSLDEKVGQMGGIRRLLESNLSFNATKFADINTLENGNLGFGAMLNRAEDVLPIANAIRAKQINSTRLGIPYITVTDSVNGPYLAGGTLFPASLSMSSSWNLPLYEKVVEVIRDENMALGTHWVLSPELEVAKEPRYGRVGEMYGEDAYLVGEFGTQYVKTMQERDSQGYVKVATTIKHFVYGLPSGGVNTASQYGGMNHIFNDLALPYIKAITEAKPLSLMASYASVDRVPMSANRYMLQDVLRDKMGFEGLIMSDATAVYHLYTQSKIAASPADAALKAVRAGLQMELAPQQPATFPTLVDVSSSDDLAAIDEAVRQILEIKFATGMFERPLPSVSALETTLRAPQHLEAARNISRESIVLLKNNGILPLPSTNSTKIAVLGPFADIINAGSYAANNCSSPLFGSTLLSSLTASLGPSNILHVPGVDILSTDPSTSHINDAVTAAKSANLAILTLGSLSVNLEDPLWTQRTDGEFYAHASLSFPGLQQDLLNAVLDTGVPTILVLSGGQAFVLDDSALRADAILHSFLGGEFTGDALVEILFGRVNPSGKLTISLPKSDGATPINYDYLPSDDQGGPSSGVAKSSAWQFPLLTRDPPMGFGFGLSYTTFEISGPSVTEGFDEDGEQVFEIAATVRNTGTAAGKEVVQLYFRQLYSGIERPVKRLVRFRKVELGSGEVGNVSMSVLARELGYYVDMEWRVDEGGYTFYLGSSSRDEDLQSVDVVVR